MTNRTEAKPILRPSSAGSTALTRVLLTLVPLLACMGPIVALFGGSLSGFRIAAILLLVVAILQRRETSAPNGLVTVIVFLSYVWVVATVALLLLRGANAYSWSEIASVVTGLALLAGIAALRDARGALTALVEGWLLAYFVTAFFAVRELVWGETLPNYYLSDRFNPIDAGFGIASTFGNPNAYALFLVASIPMFVLGLARPALRWKRAAYVVAILSMPVLLNGTDSRTGIALAVVVSVAMLVQLLRTRSVTVLGVSSLFVVLGTAFLLVIALADSVVRDHGGIVQRLDAAIMGIFNQDSFVVRWMLVRNGVDFTMETAMTGLGPGGFEPRMEIGDHRFDTMGIINPHNGFIEILSQYGLLVFVLFLVLLFVLALGGIRAMRMGLTHRSVTEGFVTVVLVIALPFLMTMNSSFLEPPIAWLLLAAMVASGSSSIQQTSSTRAPYFR